MSLQSIEEFTARGQELLRRTRALLESAPIESLVPLAQSLVAPSLQDPLRLTVTGEYNSGKSTILRALTGRSDILIDANVATSEVTEYQWSNLLLVDTPGVKAGVREEHDALAEQALRDSDLVLFVLTVDLFDDVTAAYLRHVADELGKRRQLVVAINKAATMTAPPGVRDSAVREVLGARGENVPLVECDALRFLRASERRQGSDSRGLPGNIDGLGDALTQLASGQGEQGRLRRPFEAVIAVVADATPHLGEDPAEQSLRRIAARTRRVVAASERALAGRFQDLYGDAEDLVIRQGNLVIDSMDDRGVIPEESVEEFDRMYRDASDKLTHSVQSAIEEEVAELRTEFAEIAQGPQIGQLQRLFGDDLEAQPLEGPQGGSGIPSGSGRKDSSDWKPLADEVFKWSRIQLKNIAGKGASPGSPMHTVIKNAGRVFGVKFKPYGIIKVAKVANVAITVGLFAFEGYMNYRELDKEQRERSRAVANMAEKVRTTAASLTLQTDEAISPVVDKMYSDILARIDGLDKSIDATAAARAEFSDSLSAKGAEAEAALLELDVMSGVGSEAQGAIGDVPGAVIAPKVRTD